MWSNHVHQFFWMSTMWIFWPHIHSNLTWWQIKHNALLQPHQNHLLQYNGLQSLQKLSPNEVCYLEHFWYCIQYSRTPKQNIALNTLSSPHSNVFNMMSSTIICKNNPTPLTLHALCPNNLNSAFFPKKLECNIFANVDPIIIILTSHDWNPGLHLPRPGTEPMQHLLQLWPHDFFGIKCICLYEIIFNTVLS